MSHIPFSPDADAKKHEPEISDIPISVMVSDLFGEGWLRKLQERSNHRSKPEPLTPEMLSGYYHKYTVLFREELSAVDFLHSDLRDCPQICDRIDRLEQDTADLLRLLGSEGQDVPMDIRPIDEKLFSLAMDFKQLVANGNAIAARTAMDALMVGIREIRCKLPLAQPELAGAFLAENATYLDKWIALVDFSKTCDLVRSHLGNAFECADAAQEQRAARLEDVGNRIKQDADFGRAFENLVESNSTKHRIDWTDTEWELHHLLVLSKMEDSSLKLLKLGCILLEHVLHSARTQMDTLRSCLSSLPDVSDPKQMEQYRSVMEQFRQNANQDHIWELLEVFVQLFDIPEQLCKSVEICLTIIRQDFASAKMSTEQLPHITDLKLIRQYRQGIDALVQNITANDQRLDSLLDISAQLELISDRLQESPDSVRETAEAVVTVFRSKWNP